ncbi:MAG: inositol 2-dehydrogenase [Caldilineaceae bacterium]|jgi:myo-inositol 2-dehydrogenase/D-chiro-inositol 1-dehydrogenase|nr:inositol 2-dehydrogenase [Caldilineaceae bacterium]
MPTPLNIGLIGAGRIGRVHAANLQRRIPDARIILVADPIEEAARAAADDFGVKFAVAEYQTVLQSPAVDAVVICSATHTHAAITMEAAAAGKHIFCEKPLDFDLGVIDEVLAAVKQAGVKLQMGFNRRFDPTFARVRQAVVSGEIGAPHLLHIISRDPAPPPPAYVKTSGGMFLDMTIHDFDMARFLLGAEVTELYAAAGVLVDPAIGAQGDVDTALVTLKFAGGALGVIDNSRQAVYGYDQRIDLLGSAGGIRTENLHANTATVSTNDAVRRDLPLNFFMERYTESYVVEMQAFVDAVRHDTPVPVTGEDARAATALALAARQSYAENRVITL